MNTRKQVVLRLLTAAVCLTCLPPSPLRAAPAAEPPKEEKLAVTARFLSHEQLAALAETDADLKKNLTAAWPGFTVKKESVAGALGSGLLVWAGKQIWGGIANLFKEAATEHKAEFGAVAKAVNTPDALDLEFAAIELRRDLYAPEFKNLFRSVVLLRPAQSGPNLAAYDLIPIYWREFKAAAPKVSGNEKKLTATLAVSLNAIWRNENGEPQNTALISAQWALKKYPLDTSVIPAVEYAEVGPEKWLVQTKGLPPSRSFVVPHASAVMFAELKVSEADASKAADILNKIAEAMDSQADNVGAIIKNGLD